MKLLSDFLEQISSNLRISRFDGETQAADRVNSKLRVIKERRSRESRWVKKVYVRRWKL
jgi:hypothetical protein